MCETVPKINGMEIINEIKYEFYILLQGKIGKYLK